MKITDNSSFVSIAKCCCHFKHPRKSKVYLAHEKVHSVVSLVKATNIANMRNNYSSVQRKDISNHANR